MRVEQLNLDFFGHFTDKHFNFGSGKNSASDFHVIYGPNEAGKTTIMEAYLRLLYGFPAEEPYRFQHQRKNLRVSATLEIDGQARVFSRIPARNNSLLDEQGTVLTDGSLQSHLGGLTLDDYRNLLCIDDETIEKGGQEIVSSKGDIGTLLFSAAAGIGDLSNVLTDVGRQADDLYRKRAVKTKMAVLKKEHAEIEKQIKLLDVPSSAYKKLKQAYDAANIIEQEVEKNKNKLYTQKIRLESLIAAQPLLAEIDEIKKKILPYEHYPQRMQIKPEELVTLLTNQSKAHNDAERLKVQMQSLAEALESAVYEPDHLMLDESLKAQEQLKSMTLVADQEVDKQRRKSDEFLADMNRAKRDLDISESVDPLTLVVAPAVLLEFEQALESLNKLAYGVKNEQSEIEMLRQTIESLTIDCAELETTIPGDSGLIDALEQFSASELQPQYNEAQQRVESARQDYQLALDAIASKGQRFESAPQCPFNVEELEELISELQEHAHEIESAKKINLGYEAEVEALASQIERIKMIDGLVNDEQVSILKDDRKSDWLIHKASLSAATADAFETAMIMLDDAMDARLIHAKDLGGLRQIEQSLANITAKAGVTKKHIKDRTAEKEKAEQRIAETVEKSGLNHSLTPKSFLSWLRNLENATSRESVLDQLNKNNAAIFAKANRLCDALSVHVHLESPNFNELLAEARSLETEQRSQIEKLRIAKERFNEADRAMKSRSKKMESLVSEFAAAETEWQKIVKDALSDQVSAKKLKTTLQPLRELRELDRERTAALRQVTDMEQDQAMFAQQMNALASRIGVETKGTSLETFELLKQLSESAKAAEQNSHKISLETRECTEKLSAADQLLSEIAASVKEWGKLFPDSVATGTVGELRIAVDEALSAINDRAKIDLLKSELLNKLDVDSLEDVRAALASNTNSELQADLQQVQANIEICQERYKSAIEQRVDSRKELDAVTGDAEIALLDQRKTSIALEMTEVAMHYLKLVTGLRLAEEAIRRYRDTHRSGMMQATEHAFAQLTNGAYVKLQTHTDGSAEILMAVDKAGTPKQVQDMSKGTRFQLYLALRAAAYEQLCSQGKCLPFVCDDIFETFDEQRTRSACQVLERIGQTGQAIYLTHHRHVVDIAKEVCGDSVKIHTIN